MHTCYCVLVKALAHKLSLLIYTFYALVLFNTHVLDCFLCLLQVYRYTNAAPDSSLVSSSGHYLGPVLLLLCERFLRFSGKTFAWNFVEISQGVLASSFCVPLVEIDSPKLVQYDPIATWVWVPENCAWHVSIENQLCAHCSVWPDILGTSSLGSLEDVFQVPWPISKWFLHTALSKLLLFAGP